MRVCKSLTCDNVTPNRNGYCTSCNTERCRHYRSTENGRAAQSRAVRSYESKNPDRVAAWTAAKRYVPMGPCERCGETRHVHRHHDDPANKLAVIRLCARHHKQRHAELKVLSSQSASLAS